MGKLSGHVAEAPESDHANLLALGDAPMAHRRVSRDSGAKERAGSGEVEICWFGENEPLIDNGALGVAAIRHASQMLIGKVVGVGRIQAELLESCKARGTGAVRVHHAADRCQVAGLELGYRGADARNAAHDFMAGNAWVNGGYESAPLVASLVEIGVADTAEEDFDLHVVFSWIAPRDRGGGQRRRWTGGGIRFGVVHMPIRGVRLMFDNSKYSIVSTKRTHNP